MKFNANPVKRIGNSLTIPHWRLELLQNPMKYGMQDYVSIPSANSGCLKRFVSVGLPFDVVHKIPSFLFGYKKLIGKKEFSILLKIWFKFLKKTNISKILIETNKEAFQYNPVWNLKHVEKIQDPFLRRLIYHHSKYKYDEAIATAIRLGKTEEYQEVFRFIGYCIFAGISDKEIAKRWRLSVRQVEAIRLIFFDFSHFPKDRTATLSYLRQLTLIGLFTEEDFAYYKRILELGELGLKAQTDFYHLTNEEKRKLEEYLGKTVVSNTLNLHFTIKNRSDALSYNTAVGTLNNYYIKQKEASFMDARIRHLDTTTNKLLAQETLLSEDISIEDQGLLDLIDQYKTTDKGNVSHYKTLSDLN